MINEIIIAIVSAVAGSVFTLLTTLALERRKEKREDCLEARKLQREVFQMRPEMQILEFKDYLSRVGYGIKQKCDIELFVAPIEKTTIKNNDIVYAHYKEEYLNPNEWCCIIYTFKNVGKTNISAMDIFWHMQKTSCVFPASETCQWAQDNLLNYSCCYDKKIREGETVSLKICYHKDSIIYGMISAPMSIGMIADNGRCWTQPLFAPQNKVYDSREISRKEYIEQTRTDVAEECFINPWLW